jgi:hypothetical protein
MGRQEGINFYACFNINLCYFHYVSNELDCTQNVKVQVKLTLKQATKAQRASRGIALLFL